MSGEKYGNRAVASLVDFCTSNLQTYLTATETALSLAAGTLAPPTAYIGSLLTNDPRSPLLLVDCSGGSAEDWADGIHSYNCLLLFYFSGDADIVSGETKARQYSTALIDMVRANPDLGGTVELAWGREIQFDAEHEGDRTRHAIQLEIDVRVHEPT